MAIEAELSDKAALTLPNLQYTQSPPISQNTPRSEPTVRQLEPRRVFPKPPRIIATRVLKGSDRYSRHRRCIPLILYSTDSIPWDLMMVLAAGLLRNDINSLAAPIDWELALMPPANMM